MAAALIVHPLAASHFAQWALLWAGYNSFHERTLPDEITQLTWKRLFDESEPMHALVAQQDGKLLGLVHYLFHRATAFTELNCYLSDFFTDETARGKGVGRALIEGGLREGARRRLEPRLLADPRDQPHGPTTLRQGRRTLGLHRLPQATLAGR